MSTPRIGILVATVALFAASLTGCSDTVSTNLDIDRPFTIWGIFNARSDTHAVRVFEIQDRLRLVSPDAIDATVRSIAQSTGQTRVWQDSVIQLSDGDYRHVFWDSFPVEAGETYRLEVERSDGQITSAETTIPPPISVEVVPPNLQLVREVRQLVRIEGAAPALPRIDAEYRTIGRDPDGNDFDLIMTIPYEDRALRRGNGWDVEIDYAADYRRIIAEFERRAIPILGIGLREIFLSIHVGNEDWVSPLGYFDAEALVEPGVFSNVKNGFGFVGSGYVETVTWTPPSELLQRAGFGLGR